MRKSNKSNTLSSIIVFMSISFILITMISCGSQKNGRNKIEIERLFMQTSKPNLEFINNRNSEGQDGFRILSEQVSFNNDTDGILNRDGFLNVNGAKLDTSKIYKLPEVTVNAKANFIPERNGQINLDFNIVALTEVLDPNWRVTLRPKLIDGDSIYNLDAIVLSGEGFRDKQVSDYETYNDFVSTILDSSMYDSLFVNKKTLNKEIKKIRQQNYADYQAQYELVKDYEAWKIKKDAELHDKIVEAQCYQKNLYLKYRKLAEENINEAIKEGKYVGDIQEQYTHKYKKEYITFLKKKFTFNWLDSVTVDVNLNSEKENMLRYSDIPDKFKNIHDKGITLNDIKATPFTAEDSIQLAKRHYKVSEVVINDLNINRKNDMFKQFVAFPYYESNDDLRVDTVISGEQDVVYHYNQSWAVRPGMRKLKVVMESKVEAVDRSVFNFPLSDTLTFHIASLSQLADASLVTQQEKLYKHTYDHGSIYPNYKTRSTYSYDEVLNNGSLDTFLNAYNTYTQSEYNVDSVVFVCNTDLAGRWVDNYDQSRNRGNAIANYLKKTVNSHLVVKPRGEDWNSLVKEIQERDDLPNADAILDLLTTAVYPDKTKEEIQRKYPKDYKIIKNEIYPKLNRIDYYIRLSRSDIDEDTTREIYRQDYATGLDLLRKGEYLDALKLLAPYGDYNAALSLVCLGYLDKAEDVLLKLPESAKNEYLLAIIYARKKEDNKAMARLVNACKLDSYLYERIAVDSEISELVGRMDVLATTK